MSKMKKVYGVFLRLIEKTLGIDAAKKFDTKLRFKKSLNLKNPKTLSEKVTYIELHCQSKLAPTCSDKFAVREYVKDKGLDSILVPCLGGPYNSFDEIDFSKLPDSFVIKATHGCKMLYIVTDKANINYDDCKKKANGWLKTTYGLYSVEPHYKQIPHRLYVEQYLGETSKLTDYKFHCFNGEPAFVLALSNRQADGDKAMKVTIDAFDMDWKSINEVKAANSEVAGAGAVEKPSMFNEMVEIARVLSKDFVFVRVDLYQVDNKILFGELTFTPACGVFPYFSQEFDKNMGDKLRLNSEDKN